MTQAAAEGEKQSRYKGTLNLPKTSFPMKANLVQNEPASQKRWEQADLYHAVLAKRAAEGAAKFIFHDGPPYANGNIHLGHLLNKVLKDLVVRTRLMAGLACPYVPGWDCHGLPIEHKVMMELQEAGKLAKVQGLPDDQRRMAIRRECQKYAEKFVKLQASQMKRLLTLADYDNPYLTMAPAYEGATLEVFADLVEAGLVYRQLKSVHWSIANETALADAELEYYEREDHSIYVDFEAADGAAVYDAFGLEEEDHRGDAEDAEEDRVGSDKGREPQVSSSGAASAPGTPTLQPGGLDVDSRGWSEARRATPPVSGFDSPHPEGVLVPRDSLTSRAPNPEPQTRPSQTPCFMIWTTTPWTLPANVAIAVQPSAEYALVRVDGNITIIARELVDKVCKSAKAEEFQVLATAPGSKLLGLKYRHPLYPDSSPDFSKLPAEAMRHADAAGVYRIVGAEYVTLEDGTGLVHTAPGHGADDYRTGLKEKLPIYCPVRENGTYDDSVPEWLRGKLIWDANKEVVEHLRASGHLFFDHKFTHSYPHDWRGKSPVIFRATEQWFIGVDTRHRAIEPSSHQGKEKTLREKALGTTERIDFVPEWGRNRMRGMLESRPDWCISRQRSWGLPIPAFYAPDGKVLLTPASVRAVAKAVREKGSDVWFQSSPADLLKHYDYAADKDAPRGLDVASLSKGLDIFDVWFESGCSWNAVIRERAGEGVEGVDTGYKPVPLEGVEEEGKAKKIKDFPTDLYLEGSDQHRGWFQVSLLTALGATGLPPYKTLLTHGFIVDKEGRKMSKSLGNTLEVESLMKDFGADVCRWWVATLAYDSDIKADLDFFKVSGEAYRKVRNTLRFMLSNLDDFDAAKDAAPPGSFKPTDLDTWIMAQLDELSRAVKEAYEQYDFRRATTLIFDFCNETLSAVYLSAAKDRLYCEPPGSVRRRKTQWCLHRITDVLCRLLAPVLPHTADEAWRALTKVDPKDAAGGRSVHTETFLPEADAKADEGWAAVMLARDAGLAALERMRQNSDLDNPLDACVVLPESDALARFDPVDLADLMGVSRVKLESGGSGEARVIDLRAEPRCERSWKRDGTVKPRSDGGMLCARCAGAVGL